MKNTLFNCGRRSRPLFSFTSRTQFSTQYHKRNSHVISLNIVSPQISIKPTFSFRFSLTHHHFLNTKSWDHNEDNSEEEGYPLQDKTSEGETSDGWEEEDETESEIGDGWEEEDETESEIGDGGDGGGVVLRDVPWGEHTLSLAREVLLQFGDDMKLFAFKTTPRGYIYVRLDKISNMYGCPSMEEIANYSKLYKKRLEEVGETGQIPDDLALEVSSPSAERVLKVPEDLDRFKDMPMRVLYVEGESDPKHLQKDGVFLLDSIKTESEHCVWKLANVKENRDPLSKGKPLNRKQKDWRLTLPYPLLKKVTLYLS